MACAKHERLVEILVPRGIFYFIETPILYYTHYIWYRLFSIDSSLLISLFKILYVAISFYFISAFFGIYLDRKDSYLASFLFLFFPSHDASTFWFMGLYLTLSMALYLYAFYRANNNRLISAFLLSLAASFISYGSPIIAVSLFLLFCLSRQYKKGAALLVPNIIYFAYYMLLSKYLDIGTDKLPTALGLPTLAKRLVLQILTFADSAVGPSIWLKIYYSFFQIRAVSLIAGLIAAFVFYKAYGRGAERKMDLKLVAGLSVLTVLSLLVFAATGRYLQLAFNLGNRVTIFGSLFIVYLIAASPIARKARSVVIILLLLSAFGISDHWKAWGRHQEEVVANMKKNPSLSGLGKDAVIWVSGNEYSRFGRLNHIEFLSEGFVLGPISKMALMGGGWAYPIRNYRYSDGYMVDTRNGARFGVGDYINVYDSEKDAVFKLARQDINRYINSLAGIKRHWLQLVGDPKVIDHIERNAASGLN